MLVYRHVWGASYMDVCVQFMKTLQIVHLRYVQVYVCTLHLNNFFTWMPLMIRKILMIDYSILKSSWLIKFFKGQFGLQIYLSIDGQG